MVSEQTGIAVENRGHVAVVTFERPPHNYFNVEMMKRLADAIEELDADAGVRALVLRAGGKQFCAGYEFTGGEVEFEDGRKPEIYLQGLRLYRTRKPIVAAVQGGAIGGGLGLALIADFRVAAPEAWFAANFVKINMHAGLGITYMLPRLVGMQAAADLLYTGRRVDAEEALSLGLADRLTSAGGLAEEAFALASQIAENGPMAVEATRATLRGGLADAVEERIWHEHEQQQRLTRTRDFAEGVAALRERRPANWTGS